MHLQTLALALVALAVNSYVQAQTIAPASRNEAPTAPFVLDTNYRVLASPVPVEIGAGLVEVVEVFWYGCPHCYALEPGLLEWEKEHAKRVKVVRVPAMFAPARFHAQAYYTAEALGKADEMHAAFFAEVQRNGNALDTEAKLEEFFGRFGIAPTQFKETFGSDAVKAKLQRAVALARSYRMSYVPWIVINGKYVTDPRSAGGNREVLEVMSKLTADELGRLERGARAVLR